MKRTWLITLLILLIHSAQAAPWFTGPLLAGSGQTIPEGHINIEPYFSYNDTFAIYNNHWKITKIPDTKTLNTTPIISMGINNYLDFQAVIPYDYHSKLGEHDNSPADTTFVLGMQLFKQGKTFWPNLRLAISETLPSGAYDSLNPNLGGVDAFGSGSYQTTIGLNFQQLSKPLSNHYLRTRFVLSYNMPSTVTVHGFNTYGGGFGTNGRIKPGNQFQADLAFEYQLTQHWVPVFEINYLNRKASNFNGTLGQTLNGDPATIGHGDVQLISIAPALEYNLTANIGLIAGAWVSIKGKDTADFAEAMLAINMFV